MKPLRTAVLISGGGSTLANLIEHQRLGQLPVEFVLVVSSSAKAKGLQYAADAGIESAVISRRSCTDAQEHCQKVFSLCRQRGVQLVVMGGYLEHLLIPEDFSRRVINIHPSLIPAFSGHGFYGLRVHQAALDFGVKLSGCSVHFVDNEYDHGPIIAQRACEVLCDDTAESLQQRVGELERQLLPQVIAELARDAGSRE